MSDLPSRDELALQIVNGAVAQCDAFVTAVSLLWPQNGETSLTISLYLPDRRLTIKATPEDLEIVVPKASDPVENRTPFYWVSPADPIERMRQLAAASPFDKNPWLSSAGVEPIDW